jgi:hypothetical protein
MLRIGREGDTGKPKIPTIIKLSFSDTRLESAH